MKKKALIISYSEWYTGRHKEIKDILCEKYNTMILVSDFDHINKMYIKNKHSECTYIHVPAYTKNISFRRIFSYLYFSLQVKKCIKQVLPDLIYLQVPPNYTEKYCLRYRKSHPQSKYIIDLIDLWPESLPLKKLRKIPLLKCWEKLRNNSLKEADYVFVECALYKYKLKNLINNKSKILYLFKEQNEEEKKLLRELTKNFDNSKKVKELSIAYLGSINNIIDIEGICKVLDSLISNKYKISVKIVGDGENREDFVRRLKDVGCIVHYYGRVFDSKEKIKLLGRCDYALNMMKKDIAVGLTIKSIDYFSMGIPLINNIQGDTWNLVEKYHAGINIDLDDIKDCDKRFEDFSVNRREAAYRLYLKYFTREKFRTIVREGIKEIHTME